MYTELISTQYIKDRSVVDSNVDSGLLQYYIRKAQDLHTQIILGQDLYESIMNQAGTSNFISLYYQTLLNNYIQPSLLEWTIMEALPFINFTITNKAVVQKTSEYAEGISTNDLKWLRDIQRDNASFYDQRIREYIINNPSQFPEYYTLNGVERIGPSSLTGFNYIYTSKRGRGPRGNRLGYGGCCGGDTGINLN